MPSTLDYALMAGASYIDTRGPINRLSAPQDWVGFKHVSGTSGFEAISFVKSTDLVISYAGTYAKDITGDMVADFNLATGHRSWVSTTPASGPILPGSQG